MVNFIAKLNSVVEPVISLNVYIQKRICKYNVFHENIHGYQQMHSLIDETNNDVFIYCHFKSALFVGLDISFELHEMERKQIHITCKTMTTSTPIFIVQIHCYNSDETIYFPLLLNNFFF